MSRSTFCPALNPFLYGVPVCSVEPAMDFGPFQEAFRLYAAQKFLPGHEMIVLSRNFLGTHRAGGAGYGKLQLRPISQYTSDDSGFPDSGRGRYDKKLPCK